MIYINFFYPQAKINQKWWLMRTLLILEVVLFIPFLIDLFLIVRKIIRFYRQIKTGPNANSTLFPNRNSWQERSENPKEVDSVEVVND